MVLWSPPLFMHVMVLFTEGHITAETMTNILRDADMASGHVHDHRKCAICGAHRTSICLRCSTWAQSKHLKHSLTPATSRDLLGSSLYSRSVFKLFIFSGCEPVKGNDESSKGTQKLGFFRIAKMKKHNSAKTFSPL